MKSNKMMNKGFKLYHVMLPVKFFMLLFILSIALKSNGQTNLCIGSTNQASYVGTGGTWVSSNTAVATVNSSGLVTGVAPGTATISYQTVSPTTNSLFWDFETGATDMDDEIWKYNPTTTSNSSLLSGSMTQSDNGSYEFFGNPSPRWVMVQEDLSPNNGPYIEFNTSVTTTLSSVSFNAYHEHNPGEAGPSYDVRLQLSISGGPWTNIGPTFNCTAANSGANTSINLSNTSVPAGTHRLRWVRTNGSTDGDYFALNNVTFNCSSSVPTSVYSQNYLVLASPAITIQPSTTVQNVCQNGVTAVRSVTATGPGLTYQWYVNTVNNNTSGTIINGANLASFTPPSSVVGTFYYYCIVSGTCSPAVRSSVFRVNVTASVSNAGPDQTGTSTCGLTNVTLAGNASPGTGVWSIISGTGGTITTPSSSTSNFSGVAGNSYTLRWTVTNGVCVATDDVVITFNTIPGNAALAVSTFDVEVLIVGGGGGGSARAGGGGGGGQVITTTSSISAANSVAITVGTGGAGGQNGVTPSSAIVAPNTAAYGVNSGGHGGTSSFGSINALGGAGGPVAVSSRAGGNSYSSTNVVRVGGSPSWNSNGSTNGFSGGGGAGSGGNGGNSSPTGATTSSATAGSGGAGISSNISGSAVTYGGGGGGGCANNAAAAGTGTDGGGNGGRGNAIGVNGAANRGGGGGGSGFNPSQNPNAGNGGYGVVIVRYLGTTPKATGGTITQAGGYTIHTFTTSGTFTANASTASAIVPNQSRCGEGTVTFSGTTSSGLTLDWYDSATGGTLLYSGTASYTTPSISSNTTYYVSVRNNTTGCISANRLAVTATISGASTISPDQSICAGTTPSNIVATSPGSTFQWQSSADNVTFTNISGQTSATLTGATIGNLSSSLYYRAVVTNGSCIANSPVHAITVSNLTLTSTPVSGSIIWRGNTSNDWMTLANWNQFNGANYVPVSGLPIMTSNVIIPFTSSCITNQPNIFGNTVSVNNLTIENGASLSATTGIINVEGNWVNNGIFNSATGTVNFRGNNAQSIGGTNLTEFYNLTLNKASGALTLFNPTTVSNTFTMTSGNIVTTATNLLTIGTSTTSVGSIDWTDGSVIGPLQRYYSANANGTMQSGIFPVGTSTNNRYAQINFISNPNIGGTITAEYMPGTCPIGYEGLPETINGSLITNFENEGYWSIAPSGGNLNTARYKLVLRGKNLPSVTETQSLRIIKSSNHLAWNDNVAGNGIHTATVGSTTDFTIASNNMVGFSWFNVGSGSNNPLPIELIKFEANCNQASVMINWSTASEQNAQKFIVEKSRDLINWQQVAEKSAAGNSNYLIEYDQIDTSPLAGTSYYQLRQIDFNGDESKFGPISVSCNSIEDSFVLYPNPTTGSFNVEISNTEQQTINCAVIDLSGKVVYEVAHAVNQGTTLLHFDDLQLQKGSYIFQISGGNNSLGNQLFIVN
jgi:hypothetical protein